MGAGAGVIALSSLSQRVCVERVSGMAPAQRETQLHKHTVTAWGCGGAGEAGGHIALWEWGQPPS